ncbi:MAG: ECF transporter S component [Oscillospiraceae bacterium]
MQSKPQIEKHRINKQTLWSIVMILVAIPLTILFGMTFLSNLQYYFISLMIIIYTMIPFFMQFESRKPQARELIIIAVLTAIAVASRAAFYMVPQFKPVVAIIIITGVSFGAQAGFLTGAMTGFVSNFFFGQGPWTPWQMFCFGIIGFIAGLLFSRGILKKRRLSLCIYGGLSTFFIYGGLINLSNLSFFTSEITWGGILATYVSAFWFDAVHSLATVFFLFVFSIPFIEKLDRVKQKYGLMDTQI